MTQQKDFGSLDEFFIEIYQSKFGTLPTSCQVVQSGPFLFVYIYGFISPMESILVRKGDLLSVETARNLIMNSVIDEIKGVIHGLLKVHVEEAYHDWNYMNNTGMILLVLDQPVEQIEHTSDRNPNEPSTLIHSNQLIDKVKEISALVEKVPESIKTYRLSDRIYIVERLGILIPLEKALLRKGFINELKYTKDDLEKSYFHRSGYFDDLFNQSVKDIFVDWDLNKDKSYLGFVLEKFK